MFLNAGLIYHLFPFLSLSVSLKVIFPITASSQRPDHDRPSVKHRKSSFLKFKRGKNAPLE